MPAVPHQFVIVVLEKQPYWGPELQRQFQHTETIVRECRSTGDLYPATQSLEVTVFVIDLESGLAQCLDWLGTEVPRHGITVPIIALGSPTNAELEWILRDAGVTAFIPEFITGEQLARLCRRILSPRSGSLMKHQG